MKSRFGLLLALAATAALSFVPMAEAQTAPTSTVFTYQAQQRTYAAVKLALAPAASATDFFTITGATNQRIRVRRIHCDGISTAAATAVIQVVKRSAANTGGTSTTATAVPYNSGPGVAASATVRSDTVNPTVGTIIAAIATAQLTTNTVATSAFNNIGVNFDFSDQQVFLNSGAEVLAVNANGASFTSGAALDCSVEWSEG